MTMNEEKIKFEGAMRSKIIFPYLFHLQKQCNMYTEWGKKICNILLEFSKSFCPALYTSSECTVILYMPISIQLYIQSKPLKTSQDESPQCSRLRLINWNDSKVALRSK